MKTHSLIACCSRVGLVLASVLMSVSPGQAQIVTNWAAYNDHRAGPAIPPHSPTIRTNNPAGGTGGAWGTHVRATRYDMGAPGDLSPSPLTNFFTGEQLPVTMQVTRTGAPDDFGAVNNAYGPATNSPGFNLFFGICDLSNDGIVGVDRLDGDYVTFTFAGLDPSRYYIFRGVSARGGGYLPRWAVATITNANSWIDAHINGLAGTPGVITSNDFPANLGPGQAAWNSGDNAEGDVIGWDFISPIDDGTGNGSFQIVVEQYVGPFIGGSATDANYGYSFGAILLAQVEVTAPTIVTHPVANTTVEQNRPFSLSVVAEGTPLLYQWYKEGEGEISGATFPTFSKSQAALSDAGDYYVVVHNPLDRATSTVAHVTVNADVTGPGIRKAFSFPNVPSLTQVATLDRVIVDFNEPIQPASASSTSQYVISGGVGNPTAVEVTSDRTVSLTLASPLTEDTDYTVQVSGVLDLVGNDVSNGGTNNPAAFHSWVSGPGNGLLFEAYNTGVGNGIDVLKSSPNYPDNPFLGTNLWAFDTRIHFPDNAQEGYGGRVSGAFIPPISGNWEFFFRVYERGEINLNPTGLGVAGAINILSESTGNEPRNWIRFRSRAFPLLAGDPYYIEGLYQGGTGTDVIKAAARLVGQPDPNPVDGDILLVDSNALAGAEIGFPLAPKDLGGTLTISQQPTNTTVERFHIASFSVGLNNPSDLPVIYQWYRNDVAIEGANTRVYSFRAQDTDEGVSFKVRAAKLGSVVMSDSATLEVIDDTTAPEVIGVQTSPPFTNVLVTFSESLQWAGSDNEVFNYAINEGLPAAADIDVSGTIVSLALAAPLTAGSSNQLSVASFTDLSGNVGAPTFLTFYAGVPPLSISRQGNAVRVSWPLPGTGMTLEETATFDAPIAWQDVPAATYQSDASTRYIEVTTPGGTRFYRLRED